MELDNLVELVINRVMEKINALNRKRFMILAKNDQNAEDILDCLSSKFWVEVSENYDEIKKYDYVVLESSELLKILQKEQNSYKEEKLLLKQNEQKFKIDKKVITEKDLQTLIRLNARRIYISEKAILTPLALDLVKENKVELVRER